MPARTALIPFLLTAALLAGCGGSDVAYNEVDLPPQTITVPKDSGSSGSSSASASETPTPTPTPTVTPGASSGTSSGGTSSGGTTSPGTTSGGTTSGGTTTGTGGAGTQTQTQPSQDTGGASPDQGLDQFCADNPGACDGNNP
jgi:hypothetical protein